MHEHVHMWRSANNFQEESVLSSYMDPRVQTQVVSLGDEDLCPLWPSACLDP